MYLWVGVNEQNVVQWYVGMSTTRSGALERCQAHLRGSQKGKGRKGLFQQTISEVARWLVVGVHVGYCSEAALHLVCHALFETLNVPNECLNDVSKITGCLITYNGGEKSPISWDKEGSSMMETMRRIIGDFVTKHGAKKRTAPNNSHIANFLLSHTHATCNALMRISEIELTCTSSATEASDKYPQLTTAATDKAQSSSHFEE